MMKQAVTAARAARPANLGSIGQTFNCCVAKTCPTLISCVPDLSHKAEVSIDARSRGKETIS
jgi:hypothetical protein